ncbi:MAG: hypothetical protein ACI8W6_000649 [Porticoccaceae bacterium]|jgi:hypothetical protein|tara:strand:+ start:204 stop:425 length:222 start_codon:yes stop_codon:yes gene_type:complete
MDSPEYQKRHPAQANVFKPNWLTAQLTSWACGYYFNALLNSVCTHKPLKIAKKHQFNQSDVRLESQNTVFQIF